jgi:proline racemase
MVRVRTIDAHAAGEPLRLIVDGFPAPRGKTMLEKREWVRRHADSLRRALMLELRGHADMYGAVLTEPVEPGSHAGVLFMHNEGYSTMCGHGVIAVTTIALERGLLVPGGDGRSVVYDSPAGTIRARAAVGSRGASGASGSGRSSESGGSGGSGVERVDSVAFLNVPSFVLQGGLTVKLPGRHVRADVAFGGAFYAIVDSESVGLPIDAAHLPELRHVGMEIKHAIEAQHTIAHPLEPGLCGIYGTIFTGPATDDRADLRNVTIFAKAEAPPSGVLRGRRTTMLSDADINYERHARAALGAVIASVTGDAAIFVSGGTEHQCKPGEAPIAAIVRA